MAELPTGTVTLLFTDIEGSTRLLQELGRERYMRALSDQRRLVREAFTRNGGVEVEMQGDSFHFAFAEAHDALTAAAGAQQALAEHEWEPEPIRIRIGIHTGEPVPHEGLYAGLDVHRAARIMSAGHGGQVLLSRTTRGLLDSSVELRDLGEHRLKDLAEPEWLFQLGSEEFPPLKSLNNTNLPVEASTLVGRVRELEQLADLIMREDVRLLTLTGPGGAGKTRLGLRLAADSVEHFRNGVFLVQLASVSDPSLVVSTVAHTLGVKERPGEELLTTLAEHLADKKLLLLLDNFEQVLGAAPAVEELLAGAASLKLVITSRERLSLAGEREYPVPPMEEDDAAALFHERAIAVRPDFSGNGAVHELCQRLDRLPLAIELAAARVKVLSPEALLKRLETRLPLLSGGSRSLPERQRTLSATIAWSYELLEPEERRLFAHLSVFAGGCTLEAAESVCDAELDTLQALVEKSLLHQDGDRFQMLETIREYALERLGESGEAEEVRRNHAEHYTALARAARPELTGPEQRVWLDRLEVEHDNLRAALDWCVLNDAALAGRLASSLWLFWYQHGHLREALQRIASTLDLGDALPADSRVELLDGAGLLLREQHKFDEATALHEQQLALSRELGDGRAIARSLHVLGADAVWQGDVEGGVPLIEEGVGLLRELGEELPLAEALNDLSLAHFQEGEKQQAAALLEESMMLQRRLGNRWGVAFALNNLGILAMEEREFDRATSRLAEGLQLFASLGDKQGVADTFMNFAEIALVRGEGERAARLWGASEVLREAIGAHIGPLDEAQYERDISAARAQVGETSFAVAWAEGRKMNLGTAITYALEAMAAATPS